VAASRPPAASLLHRSGRRWGSRNRPPVGFDPRLMLRESKRMGGLPLGLDAGFPVEGVHQVGPAEAAREQHVDGRL